MTLCHYDICPLISLHPNSTTLFKKALLKLSCMSCDARRVLAHGEAQSPLRKFQQAQEARNGSRCAAARCDRPKVGDL